MTEDSKFFAAEDSLGEKVPSGASEVQSDKFLIFLSDGLRFGVDATYVVEIITNHAVTHLPMLPEYVSGIINLRGQIIPIIDIRLRLGKELRKDCIIIVLDVEGTQVGILVDTVAQMVDIAKQSIMPMPANNTMKLTSGMCSLQNGDTIMVIDCELLLQI